MPQKKRLFKADLKKIGLKNLKSKVLTEEPENISVTSIKNFFEIKANEPGKVPGPFAINLLYQNFGVRVVILCRVFSLKSLIKP